MKTGRLMTVVALVFSVGSGALAQAPDTQPAAASESDPRAKELRRVFTLTGGTFLRAKSRWVGESWEYLDNSAWKPLPASAVASFAEERDLLDQSKRLLAQLGNDQGARRAAYADWLLSHGLLKEGVQELDKLLARDPDQPDARKVAIAHAALFRVDASDPASAAGLDAWMRAACGLTPSLREVALTQLDTRVEDAALAQRLARGLTASSPREREVSALGLRRLYPGQEVRGLSRCAVLDGSENVREEAALALRDAKDSAVVGSIIGALGSRYGAVRANAVEALGAMGYPEAVQPLVEYMGSVAQSSGYNPPHSYIFVGRQQAYIMDYDVEVAQFSAAADPIIGTLQEGAVLDARVLGSWEVDTVIETSRAARALSKLTGAEPGRRLADWQAWWRENGSRYATATEPAVSRPTTGS